MPESPFRQRFKVLFHIYQHWLLSACCPLDVRLLSAFKADNKRTSSGQQADNRRCWWHPEAEKIWCGNDFYPEKIVAYQKKIVPLQIQKPEKNTIRKPTIAN
jgi:hypothetical protein